MKPTTSVPPLQTWLAVCAVLAALAVCPSRATADSNHRRHPANDVTLEALDLGPVPGSGVITVSLGLNVHNEADLEAYVRATATPGDPAYQNWLTVPRFTAIYSPGPAEIAAVTKSLRAAGIQVVSVSPNRLLIRATGTVDAFNAYFATSLHNYSKRGVAFQAAATAPAIPADISGTVLAVSGLSTENVFHSHARAALGSAPPPVVLPSGGAIATGVPQDFTVGDVARLYNVNPLYAAGYLGKGRTIGIATLATFSQSDAYGYWSGIGLTVKPNRITEVQVDGGASSDGALETTLDVEQSGGLAPRADLIVYEGPNTDGGFVDVFVAAVCDNKVDTLSVSWGEAEEGATPGLPSFQNLIFLEAAAQGISVFAASGDAGAYDLNSGLPYGFYSDVLTVDVPASAPYITGAGGLTLPVTLQFANGGVTVPNVRAWAWDYLQDYFTTWYGSDFYFENLFPSGGGGGVSLLWNRPWYQHGVDGVLDSTAQSLLYYPNYPDTSVFTDLLDLPGGFAGRNVPDVSLNADPETGYLVYFQGAWQAGWGGTSFVAPQLNGIFSLVSQEGGQRLGFLNPAFYQFSSNCDPRGGGGNKSGVTDVASGDNLHYNAVKGYDPASGVGSLNVANFAKQLLNAAPSH